MSFKLKSMPLAISSVIATGALSMAAVNPAFAQTTSAEPAPQRVVVTGSLISRATAETATPVQVITAADIQRSGKTSVAELLSDLAANGAGTLGTGFSGAFANGASGVSLRGLSVGATLVLLDGHRVAPYALGDDAQRSFVDVSNIPFDAIESIEILKAGASSLYGSDAVAGVVNIKLKKNYTGTRVAAEAGNTQHGGGKTQRASISTGLGDLDTDGYNAFVTAEWRHQGAIKISDRTGNDWNTRDWRSRGGNDLTLGVPTAYNNFLTQASTPFLYNASGTGGASNPANFSFLDPSCNYTKYRAGQCAVTDNSSYIQPETDNINVLLGMTKKLGSNWELAFKGSFFKRDGTNNRGVPPVYSTSSFVGFNALSPNGSLSPAVGAINPTTFAPGAAVGAGVVNPFVAVPAIGTAAAQNGRARLYGYIPGVDATSTSANTATATRFSLDLTGNAWGWDTRIAAGMTESKVQIDYSGYVDRVALYNALTAGTFNVLGGNSPAQIAAVSPKFSNTNDSKLNYFDVSGSRELTQLMAGPLVLAGGFHYHKREWNAPPSSLTVNGQVGSTSPFVFGTETNTAGFAELQLTPLKNLELDFSARYDHFDTYGNSFTPAANFKWTPVKQFALRGNFARGFRAPNPSESGSAGSFFSYNAITDPVLCASGSRTTPGSVPVYCSFTPVFVQQTSQTLSPEKSKSYDLGIVLAPTAGLGATLDYYKIDLSNQIVSAATSDPNYVPAFVRGAPTQMDTVQADGSIASVLSPVGPILYATSGYINAGKTTTSGIEAAINYRFRLPGEMGTLRADLSAAHTFDYTQSVNGTSYQLAGTQGPSGVGGATGNPKDRAQFSLNWNRGPLDVTANVNYTSSFSTLDPSVGATDCASTGKDAGGRNYFDGVPGGQPDYYCHTASFTVTNLNVQYKLSPNLTLKGTILNVFDKAPPIDVGTYGNSGVQTSYNASLHQAGAVGRFFSLGLAYVF
ncbi:MAG: TonB-dependent receptor [Pseudomonadota bacterium]|nr:TonB-dependent receptor [Pseudomonadota bacterium]